MTMVLYEKVNKSDTTGAIGGARTVYLPKHPDFTIRLVLPNL
jgi:hypothetical protein